MTDKTATPKPLSLTQLAALGDLLATSELPRHGDFFVAADGTRYMTKTISALAKQSYCHVRHDVRGHIVARVDGNIRSIVDVHLNGPRRASLIAEADDARKKSRERKAKWRRSCLAAEADELAEKEMA